MLQLIIIQSLINTTLLTCFKKWGWLDYYSAYRKLWMPSADCFLCLGFWCSWIGVGIASFSQFNYTYLLVPFASAALTNYLTNNAMLHEVNKQRKY
jgi:hypothetical protein